MITVLLPLKISVNCTEYEAFFFTEFGTPVNIYDTVKRKFEGKLWVYYFWQLGVKEAKVLFQWRRGTET